MRPIMRRECYFRCYCNRPGVCYIRPHPGHKADHGVAEREVSVSKVKTVPAPTCDETLGRVKGRGIC